MIEGEAMTSSCEKQTKAERKEVGVTTPVEGFKSPLAVHDDNLASHLPPTGIQYDMAVGHPSQLSKQ